ncbi:MAG: PorV/PorQ family protein [Elusimicrobiota bacterium]
MKTLRVLFLISLLSPTVTFGESGRTALNVLNRSFGGRTAAVGQAQVADQGEIDALGINPAGLSQLNFKTLDMTYNRGVAEDNFGFVAFGVPTRFGAISALMSHLDAGTINLNLSDGTQGTRRAQQDTVAGIGLALGRSWPVSLGVNAKVFKSELAETVSASGFATDLGAQWQTPWKFLSFGYAFQNVGADIKYDQAKDKLPTTQRVGTRLLLDLHESHKLPEVFQNRYLILADALKPRFEDGSINMGIEIKRTFLDSPYLSGASLRGGYVGSLKSAAVGVGFGFGPLTLDYGITFVGSLDNNHRVSLLYRFGGAFTQTNEPLPEKPALFRGL